MNLRRLLDDLQGSDPKARQKAAWDPDLRRELHADTLAVFQKIIATDEDPSVLAAAFQYVQKHSDRTWWTIELVRLLDDPRPAIVRFAALHLGQMKAKQAGDAVLRRLERGPTWELLYAAGECCGAEAVPLLAGLLDTSLRVQVVTALGRLQVSDARPHLERLLTDRTVGIPGDHPGEPPTLICDLAQQALAKLH